MTEKIAALPQEEQGETNRLINSYKNNLEGYKTIEIPDTLPGCYQDYKGVDECIGCLYRLPCARASAGGNNE